MDTLIDKYLTEDINNIKNITDKKILGKLEKVEKDCSQILKVYKKAGKVLWRGSQSLFRYGFFSGLQKFKSRKHRHPMDTSLFVHKILDDMFEEKFGWKARSENSVFVTGHENLARDFGETYIFLPFDGFEFIWSPKITDLYTKLNSYKNNYGLVDKTSFSVGEFEAHNLRAKFDKKINEIVTTYTNKELDQAIKSKNEIMFHCEYYYGLGPYGIEGDKDINMANVLINGI